MSNADTETRKVSENLIPIHGVSMSIQSLSRKLFFIALLLLSQVIVNYSFAAGMVIESYTVVEGDNISEILEQSNVAPLYIDQKWVKKALALNKLTEESVKKISVGEVLSLPQFNAQHLNLQDVDTVSMKFLKYKKGTSSRYKISNAIN
jgi:hypothetical protein